MERWWPRNPWRGLVPSERLRLLRLCTSGQRIEDGRDAKLVHDYLDYMEWYNGTIAAKFVYTVGPFVAFPILIAGLVLSALRGDVWQDLLTLVALGGFVAAIRVNRSRLRGFRRTAEANGWEELG